MVNQFISLLSRYDSCLADAVLKFGGLSTDRNREEMCLQVQQVNFKYHGLQKNQYGKMQEKPIQDSKLVEFFSKKALCLFPEGYFPDCHYPEFAFILSRA